MKLNHILVTTDLSPESLRPLQEATELARTNGAKLTMMTVIHDLQVVPHGAPFAPPLSDPEVEPKLEAAREKLIELTSDVAGVQLETMAISAPNIPDAVCHFAEQHEVDLVAISTHGRTGWRRMAMGSIAEAIVRQSPVPVLVFPRPHKS